MKLRLWAAIALGAVLVGVLSAARWVERATATQVPHVPAIGLPARLVVDPPLLVTVTAGAEHPPWATTESLLRHSRLLWRLMSLNDWNTVPTGLREDSLKRMLTAYHAELIEPQRWDRMTARDWDAVPQPVRTVAYRQMTAYWSGFYAIGKRYQLDPAAVRETLAAVIMSESWFDHRALHVDETGNRDIGLAQASDFARARLRVLAANGVVDAAFDDAAYENPWQATRFVAIWMSLLLDENRGDLWRAVRAYNRGTARADDQGGQDYAAAVQRRLHRFIRNLDSPPAWSFVWRRGREIERNEWPWVSGEPAPPSLDSTAAPVP